MPAPGTARARSQPRCRPSHWGGSTHGALHSPGCAPWHPAIAVTATRHVTSDDNEEERKKEETEMLMKMFQRTTVKKNERALLLRNQSSLR